MLAVDINDLEKNLRDRFQAAKNQDEKDNIASLVLLFEIKNLLKQQKYRG